MEKELKIESAYIVFADIKGFSKLKKENYKYFDKIYNDIYKIFKDKIKSKHIIAYNTWGDAITISSKDENIVKNILKLREYFSKDEYLNDKKLKKLDIPKLRIRIACHYGKFYNYTNNFTKREDFIGEAINTTARIEPITRPNEIFVTRAFKQELENDFNEINKIKFYKLGELDLAKDFGKHELYILKNEDEHEELIDKLQQEILIDELPDIKPLHKDIKEKIERKYLSYNQKEYKKIINKIVLTKDNSEELMMVITNCKNDGYYNEALVGIKKLKEFYLDSNGIKVYPYQTNTKLLKTEVNSLTRLGQYEEAGYIIYNLWKSGDKDGDTLSMLAAQYKRNACYDKEGKFRRKLNSKNNELLIRSLNLYLEAFKLSFKDDESYYPAINAAYISRILHDEQYERYNTELTNFIINNWNTTKRQNWWLGSTVAQAHLLQGDYEKCLAVFAKTIKENIEDGNEIPKFEYEATIQQIEMYKFYRKSRNSKELDKVIEFLENNKGK